MVKQGGSKNPVFKYQKFKIVVYNFKKYFPTFENSRNLKANSIIIIKDQHRPSLSFISKYGSNKQHMVTSFYSWIPTKHSSSI